jgi:hypothetical protein
MNYQEFTYEEVTSLLDEFHFEADNLIPYGEYESYQMNLSEGFSENFLEGFESYN